MKKHWNKIGIILAVVICGFFLFTGFKNQSDIKCWDVTVHLKVKAENALISSSEIKQDLLNSGISIIGNTVPNIHLEKIKTFLNSNPLIKNVTVHKTVDGLVKVSAEQRVPFIRIINEHGASFLVDKEGVKMPTLPSGNPRLTLFTGRIQESFDGTTLSLLKVNKTLRETSILDEIYYLADFIETSDFWKNQVEHVYVNADQEFEIVPRVGSHKILLGTAENIENKFNRLELFYKETIGKKDWNNYAAIDLRFEDQVVCKKQF